jgi:hypothetical protein
MVAMSSCITLDFCSTQSTTDSLSTSASKLSIQPSTDPIDGSNDVYTIF